MSHCVMPRYGCPTAAMMPAIMAPMISAGSCNEKLAANNTLLRARCCYSFPTVAMMPEIMAPMIPATSTTSNCTA
jgi:hypothetical protein